MQQRRRRWGEGDKSVGRLISWKRKEKDVGGNEASGPGRGNLIIINWRPDAASVAACASLARSRERKTNRDGFESALVNSSAMLDVRRSDAGLRFDNKDREKCRQTGYHGEVRDEIAEWTRDVQRVLELVSALIIETRVQRRDGERRNRSRLD